MPPERHLDKQVVDALAEARALQLQLKLLLVSVEGQQPGISLRLLYWDDLGHQRRSWGCSSSGDGCNCCCGTCIARRAGATAVWLCASVWRRFCCNSAGCSVRSAMTRL